MICEVIPCLNLCCKNQNAFEMWKSHGVGKTCNEMEVNLLCVNKVCVFSVRQSVGKIYIPKYINQIPYNCVLSHMRPNCL